MTTRGAQAAAPVAAALGFFSVAAQTVLARELLVVFHGSEISLGVVLAAWLLLGGAGSALAARALGGRRPGVATIAATAGAAVLALPLAVLGARWAPSLLALTPGVVPGLRVGALASLAVLAVPAAAGGAWFAVAAGLGGGARGAGRAYAWESVGGLLGGATVAIAFAAGVLDAFTLSSLLAAAALAGVAWIIIREPSRGAPAVAAGLVALALAAALAGQLGGLAARSQAARWPGLEVLATRDGRHGNAALVRRADQVTLFENGEPALSFPDPESAEAAAHLPLLAAPSVDRVLVTAEALGGALAEVLKHPVTAVDCIVADPQAAALAIAHLPPELAAAAADPRVSLRSADPRAWIAAHPGAYDAVLLGAVEPTSALADRLATREFFALVRAALRPVGVAALSLSAPPNYAGRAVQLRNAAVARALAAAFSRVEVLRAAPLTLLASDAPAPLVDAARLGARLRERRIAVKTLSPEVIAALLEPERAAEADRELRATHVSANSDAAPSAYLYHARFRETAADPAVASWLAALDGPARWAVFALPLLAGALAVLPGRPPQARLRPALGGAAAAAGFTAMGLQFLLLFVYQTARGLLYVALGVLSGVFMGGLAAGSALALALHRRGAASGAALRGAAGALVSLPAFAGAAFAGILATGSGSFAPAADVLAGVVAAACGLATGAAFALITLAAPERAGGTGGTYYALDLAGSAAGALLASLWLLPLLGLPVALFFLAALQAATALSLWRAGAFALR